MRFPIITIVAFNLTLAVAVSQNTPPEGEGARNGQSPFVGEWTSGVVKVPSTDKRIYLVTIKEDGSVRTGSYKYTSKSEKDEDGNERVTVGLGSAIENVKYRKVDLKGGKVAITDADAEAGVTSITYSILGNKLIRKVVGLTTNERVYVRVGGSKNERGQQGGADQPATAPEPKPEGNKKPKPDSEGRSQ